MSRLFSQLENIGHDRTDVERPAADQEADAAGSAPASTPAEPHHLSAAPPPPADAPPGRQYSPASTAHPQIPGYAIASQLSLSSSPVAPSPPSRATWPVRLWFLALLTLIGVSLAMLLSPRDDTTASQRPAQRPAAIAPAPTDDDAPSLPPAAPSSPAKAKATVKTKPATAVAPVARAVDKPVAQAQPPQPSEKPAAPPATAPRAPAGDAGCSAAMAAMNLCSASHP